MNETKFKVGQRYRTAAGNIIEISKILNEAYVRYKLISGKDAGSDSFHINSLYAKELTLVCEKIVITTDGKTTTAKLYDGKKFVKSAKAVCSPDDEFDFNIGSALALERLVGNSEATLPEETWYNGKVVCVDNVHNKTLYTSGKIYEFKDGYMINNDNVNVRFRNFKQFMNFTASKFIEVVE